MKKFAVILACLLQTACTTPARMTVSDLSNYKINCDRRHEQYQFLESQRYSEWDRLKLALQMTSGPGVAGNVYHGTAQDSSAGMNGEHEAMINAHQNQLRQRCLLEDSFKQPQR